MRYAADGMLFPFRHYPDRFDGYNLSKSKAQAPQFRKLKGRD